MDGRMENRTGEQGKEGKGELERVKHAGGDRVKVTKRQTKLATGLKSVKKNNNKRAFPIKRASFCPKWEVKLLLSGSFLMQPGKFGMTKV